MHKLRFPALLSVLIITLFAMAGCAENNPPSVTSTTLSTTTSQASTLTTTDPSLSIDAPGLGEVPEEVKAFLIRYFEAFKTDLAEAASYRYFADPDGRQRMEESMDYLVEYEILSWEKMSDDLWLATVNLRCQSDKNSRISYQFVGRIDGAYYILTAYALDHTEQLKGDLDISPYLPTGENILYPDEILIVDGIVGEAPTDPQ